MNNILNIIDQQLAKLTDKVPEKWSTPLLILSFLIILNICDYLVVDQETYAVIGAIALVIWMVLGIRLREAYRKKK